MGTVSTQPLSAPVQVPVPEQPLHLQVCVLREAEVSWTVWMVAWWWSMTRLEWWSSDELD